MIGVPVSARDDPARQVCTGPRASLRACSYHASPGACQVSVLCISLWIIWVNTLVSHSTAVDEQGGGKVDNRPDPSLFTRSRVFGCPQAEPSIHRRARGLSLRITGGGSNVHSARVPGQGKPSASARGGGTGRA